MNYSIFRIPLNLHSVQSQASVPVFLGDTSIQLRISLSDGVKPYIIADGCLAKISIKRPSGSTLEAFCTIENNTTVVYSFDKDEITKQTAVVEGIHDCDVTLYGKDGGILGSPRFTMVVNEKVINKDDIVITDEDQTIIDAIVATEAARQDAEKGRINNEADRVDAEALRVQAEEQRVLLEEARVEAEKLREANVGKVEEALTLASDAAKSAAEAAAKATEAAYKADEAINKGILTESDVIDNLVTSASNKPLSANQGVELKTLIEGLREEIDGISQNQPTNPDSPGTPGTPGVSVTHSWDGTILTLTSASGTTHTDLQGAPGKDGTDGEDGEDGYTPIKGVDYFDGKDGKDGEDGKTPTILNGYWYINGENTNQKAVGTDGKDGKNGTDGIDGKNGTDGYTPIKGVDYFDGTNGKDGADGHTPQILNGYWHINGENTGYKAIGTDGKDGKDGTNGTDGKDGTNGNDGVGIESITSDGYSTNDGRRTDHYEIKLTDGRTVPFSVSHGINGKDGVDGTNGKDGTNGNDGVGIQSIAKTSTNGLVDTYTITLTNGNTQTFTVTNGTDGKDGADGTGGGGSAIYLYKTSSADDFRDAIDSYIHHSTAVIYSDEDYELCFLVGVLDLAGEPKYYFLKLSKDEYIVVSTNVDIGTVSILRRNVGSKNNATLVETEEEMDEILANATDANVGSNYQYFGITGKYKRGYTYKLTQEIKE